MESSGIYADGLIRSPIHTNNFKQNGNVTYGIPEVSIIVPVYNAERYLPDCLNSIAAQTLVNIEIIAVNDGSTDDSLSILKKASEQDDRIIVIDKENAGYGSAVNVGLDLARAEYIAIVEPDDMVDSHMMEDLLLSSSLPNGNKADIVKSSYWNYYDYEDGTLPHVETPNLAIKMPSTPTTFNVRDNWEILYHHPSIWSALYRRQFLQDRCVRMREFPGAGWADNPWFYETLLQAEHINWVPYAYYYYRQTNVESSSYLKDVHLPFDRLGDMYDIIQRLGIEDNHMLVCFYHRTFSYIKSVLEKFHFSESNEEVFSLIIAALKRIDPDVLYSARSGIRKEHIEYYEHALGIRANKIETHRESDEPALSIFVMLSESRPYVWDFLESCARQSNPDFEAICIDAGCTDRSIEVARQFQAKDKRFKLAASTVSSFSEAYSLLLSAARGKMVYFADVRYPLPDGFLDAMTASLAGESCVDVVFFPDKDASATTENISPKRLALESADVNAVNVAFGLSFLDTLPSRNFSSRIELVIETLHSAKTIVQLCGMRFAPKRYAWAKGPLAYIEAAQNIDGLCLDWLPEAETKVTLTEDPELIAGFHGFAAKALCGDIKSLESYSEFSAYLAALQNSSIISSALDVSRVMSPNGGYAEQLRRYLGQKAGEIIADDNDMLRKRCSDLQTKIARLQNSTSYRVGGKIVKLGKSILGGNSR